MGCLALWLLTHLVSPLNIRTSSVFESSPEVAGGEMGLGTGWG